MSDSVARRRLARAAAALNLRAGHALPPLVLMTDDDRLADPVTAAAALPRGSMVVVRARDRRYRTALAATLVDLGRSLVVLIADDPALAARSGADGIHLPEARAREAPHWRARYPGMLLTASVHSLSALARAQSFRLDAVFLSPVFSTASHPGRIALSPLRAGLIAKHSRVPVYALGGIDAQNAGLLNGFVGIAAINGLSAGASA